MFGYTLCTAVVYQSASSSFTSFGLRASSFEFFDCLKEEIEERLSDSTVVDTRWLNGERGTELPPGGTVEIKKATRQARVDELEYS